MRTKLVWALFFMILPAFACHAFAADGSSLKPPAGARVAVVVFEDLECPACARAYPIVWETARAHHVPVVLHDFPLSKHPWAFEAAIYARYFDTRSQQTGNDFRGFIYKNQDQINPENLKQWAQKFADENHVPLPFAVDPQGKLKEEVQADYELGRKCNLNQTPTVFVIGAGTSPSFQEVTDLNQLTTTIEDMQKRAGAAASPTPAKRAAKRVH